MAVAEMVSAARLRRRQEVVVAERHVNELARVESKREGLAGELDGARATMADIEREREGLAEEGSSLRGVVSPQYRGGIY